MKGASFNKEGFTSCFVCLHMQEFSFIHSRSISSNFIFYIPVLTKPHLSVSWQSVFHPFWLSRSWGPNSKKKTLSTLLAQSEGTVDHETSGETLNIAFLLCLYCCFSPNCGLPHALIYLSARLKAHFVHHNKITGKDKSGRAAREGRWEKITFHIHPLLLTLPPCRTKEKITEHPPIP